MNYDKKSFLTGLEVGLRLSRMNDGTPAPVDPGYITFSSSEAFTVGWTKKTGSWNGTIEYSLDAATWITWNRANTIQSVNNVVYMRGIVSGDLSDYDGHFELGGQSISCKGNIENLIDWQTVESGNHPGMISLAHLFRECTSLISGPSLPALTLTEACYSYMYYGCRSLTVASELPAKTLAVGCYGYMYYGCRSLLMAPEIPATTFPAYCCTYMFAHCTSMVSTPDLHAQTLGESSCSGMYSECVSLTAAPEIPATTFPAYCCSSMFAGCLSMVSTPDLHAQTLGKSSCNGMYNQCVKLALPPAIPAITIERLSCANMFFNCRALTALSKLRAQQLKSECYYRMYYGCAAIRIYTEYSSAHPYEFRIPTNGTATQERDSVDDMFDGIATGPSTPEINTTYYVEHPPV